MTKSIISNVRECLICKTTEGLERHHVFFGTANRAKSEEDGSWVWLCHAHHRTSNMSVHMNRKTDLKIKKITEQRWIRKNGTEEDFIRRYGKSWLNMET